jgi:hypothetical protein
MAVTLSGMNLYTNSDNEGGYDGVTAGPDTYNVAEQGTNSESWNVAKNSTETSTLTKTPGTAPSATRGLYVFWMKSDVFFYYTDIQVELQSSASNYKNFVAATAASPDISGDFKAIALDYVNKGTSTGTYAPASHTATRIAVNNSSSGNIRSVVNNWIDAIYFGPGLTIAGTTASDQCFTEAFTVNNTTANKYGILSKKGSIIFSQGDIEITGTALTSEGETLEFLDTTNGYDRYELDGTGTLTLVNSTIRAAGTVDFNMDTSSMTYSMTGGAVVQCNQLTTGSSNTYDGVVFTDVNLSSIANTPLGCTWNLSGLVTLATGGTLDGCTINDSTGAVSVLTDSLDDLTDCTINSDGSNHAVELSSVGGGTMSWDTITTGYETGASASPVTDTSTGNEDIYVNLASGTLTISVSDGATIPSIRLQAASTAVVNVVAGQKTFTQTIAPTPTPDYEYRLYTVTAEGDMAGAVEITAEGEEFATTGSHAYTHTETNQPVAVQIISNDYVESTSYFTLTAADLSVTINLELDTND